MVGKCLRWGTRSISAKSVKKPSLTFDEMDVSGHVEELYKNILSARLRSSSLDKNKPIVAIMNHFPNFISSNSWSSICPDLNTLDYGSCLQIRSTPQSNNKPLKLEAVNNFAIHEVCVLTKRILFA